MIQEWFVQEMDGNVDLYNINKIYLQCNPTANTQSTTLSLALIVSKDTSYQDIDFLHNISACIHLLVYTVIYIWI